MFISLHFNCRHLHTVIRESGKLETFSFCDPTSTYNLNDDYELDIVNRMEGNVNRIFFLPFFRK